MSVKFVLFLIIAYFLGNISPSTILGKMQGVDIKKEGSGNAGTTNAMRVLGVKAGVITLVVDVLKGFLAVWLGMHCVSMACGELCMIFVLLGHVYPVLLKFQGGKGVAAAFGAILAVNWPSALGVLLVAVAGAAITRKMSVGSLAAAISFPFFVYWFYPVEGLSRFLPISVVMALLIVFTHRKNIDRLIRGEENNISFGKKKDKK
ncbi:MAG: glycerol-3-phosphate 1-O-acyltransferase PlsY [Mogibacterium sp.]|nr:glycerol-3-phosphate 1-O-acyltransferase PlsY [Mogibacterium sp.]